MPASLCRILRFWAWSRAILSTGKPMVACLPPSIFSPSIFSSSSSSLPFWVPSVPLPIAVHLQR